MISSPIDRMIYDFRLLSISVEMNLAQFTPEILTVIISNVTKLSHIRSLICCRYLALIIYRFYLSKCLEYEGSFIPDPVIRLDQSIKLYRLITRYNPKSRLPHKKKIFRWDTVPSRINSNNVQLLCVIPPLQKIISNLSIGCCSSDVLSKIIKWLPEEGSMIDIISELFRSDYSIMNIGLLLKAPHLTIDDESVEKLIWKLSPHKSFIVFYGTHHYHQYMKIINGFDLNGILPSEIRIDVAACNDDLFKLDHYFKLTSTQYVGSSILTKCIYFDSMRCFHYLISYRKIVPNIFMCINEAMVANNDYYLIVLCRMGGFQLDITEDKRTFTNPLNGEVIVATLYEGNLWRIGE
jgi:hypothetical protein